MEKSQPPPYDGGVHPSSYPPQAAPPGAATYNYAPPPQLAYNYAPSPQPVYAHPAPPMGMQSSSTNNNTSTTVVIGGGGTALGGCPICHNNSWSSDFSCCAWLWCLCCFPVGLICCLCMRRKKCSQCGYTCVVVGAGGGNQLGGCPICHNNSWTSHFDFCAWIWLICFFPIGIICCLSMRKKKCTQCGFTCG